MSYSKLSICIPTYNRPELLKNTIENLVNNIYKKDFLKEILIIDNSEKNDSKDIVKNYLKDYGKIRYIKNHTNLGAEGNFKKSIYEATGEYIWIIGDDDILEKDSQNLLDNRFKIDFDCLIVNWNVYDFNLKDPVAFNILKGSDSIYNDKDLILKEFGLKFSFISSIIFKKQLFESKHNTAYNEFKKYGLSFLVFVYSIFLNESNLIFFEKTSLIRQRGVNNNYLSRADKYYNIFAKGFSNVFDFLDSKGYSRIAIRSSKIDSFYHYIVRDLINRKINNNEFDTAFRYAKFFYGDILIIKWILLMIYLIPSPIFVFLKFIKKSLS